MSKRNRAIYFLTYPILTLGLLLLEFIMFDDVASTSNLMKFIYIFFPTSFLILIVCATFFGYKVNSIVGWVLNDVYLFLILLTSSGETEFVAGMVILAPLAFAISGVTMVNFVLLTVRGYAKFTTWGFFFMFVNWMRRKEWLNCKYLYFASLIITVISFAVCAFVYKELFAFYAVIVPATMYFLLCVWTLIRKGETI